MALARSPPRLRAAHRRVPGQRANHAAPTDGGSRRGDCAADASRRRCEERLQHHGAAGSRNTLRRRGDDHVPRLLPGLLQGPRGKPDEHVRQRPAGRPGPTPLRRHRRRHVRPQETWHDSRRRGGRRTTTGRMQLTRQKRPPIVPVGRVPGTRSPRHAQLTQDRRAAPERPHDRPGAATREAGVRRGGGRDAAVPPGDRRRYGSVPASHRCSPRRSLRPAANGYRSLWPGLGMAAGASQEQLA